MVKTIKLALSLQDEELSFADLCKELFEMQYLSAKACNRVMTFLYADKQQEFIMKESGIELPKPKDLYDKSRMGYLYDKIGEIMTTSYSGIVNQTRSFVENQFSTDCKKGLLKGNVSITNFRRDGAIYLSQKSYELVETEKGLGVKLSLFNREKTRSLGRTNGKVLFLFPHMNAGEKAVLNNIIDCTYKQGSASLTYNKRKKKWMLSINFSFTPKECTGENTLTVRLGTEVLLTLTVKDCEKKEKILSYYEKNVPGLEELESVQKKFKELRRKYGNITRIASDNNSGKGYKKRAEKFLSLQTKEHNFRNTFNHKISRYIVDMAKRYDCGLIELEDFSKTENAAFGNWAYYDLMSKITYKAEEEGIQTIETSKEEA